MLTFNIVEKLQPMTYVMSAAPPPIKTAVSELRVLE